MASYLSAVTDVKLSKTLTMYRLSEHSLAVETGRRRQTWLSREDRLCSHCMLGLTETELHFLTECPKYLTLKTTTTPKMNTIFPQFSIRSPTEKLQLHSWRRSQMCNYCCKIRIIVSSPEGQPERNTQITHTHTHTHLQPTNTTPTLDLHKQPINTHTHSTTHTVQPHTHTLDPHTSI